MTNKILGVLLAIVFSASGAFAQTTVFTFQGKLNDGAAPANGTYQFQFKLYDAASDGSQIGQTIADIPVTVTNGIFAVNLDFGGASFDGEGRYIEIGLRMNGSPQPYTILNPRQTVASTPYAVKSLRSDEATNADTATNSLNLGGIAAGEYVQTTDTRMTDDRNPTANSGHYVQNGTSQQTTSNFNISGEGKASVINATTQYNLNGVRILDGSLGGGNLLTGFEAGMNNTGIGTTFVGVRAGKSNTTGIYNSFFGYQAGLSNLTTEGNSFFGTFAGMNNIAAGNSFFGSYTGRDNTTGIENSYFGQAAGMQTTTGKSNSYFGNGAGYSNFTGANNTFIGTHSGLSNTIENNNTFIGYKTNGAAGITNATAIGANAVVTASDTMVLGTGAVTVQIPGSANIAGEGKASILNATTQYNLNGARILVGSLGKGNFFAGFDAGTNNGSLGGGGSFAGVRAGQQNTTGNHNSFFGHNSGIINTTGSRNSFFGAFSGGTMTTENENTFMGYGADGAAGITNSAAIGAFAYVTTSNTMVLGTNAVTVQVPGAFSSNFVNATSAFRINNMRVFHLTGTDNTFVGVESGNSVTTGKINAFFGKEAGKNTTDGINNTFAGAFAGRANVTGDNNAFFGANAGLSSVADGNSFFGSNAGFSTTTGKQNAFFGASSGLNNTTGQLNAYFGFEAGKASINAGQNAFFGARAGSSNQGSDNAFLGARAGEVNTSGGGNVFVGSSAGSSNTIGDANTFIGIGAGSSNTTGSENIFIVGGFENETGNKNVFIGNLSGGTFGHQYRNLALGYNARVGALHDATAIGVDAFASTPFTMILGNSTTTVQAPGGFVSFTSAATRIDHPLDPANKYLTQASITSPDMLNVYNGNIQTDENGDAIVTMPAYLETLNRDFRYQLTVIGQFAQAIVGEEIKGNRFTIRTDKPNVKVSWQVTGIRQDAVANQNRVEAESLKPDNERGTYLNPAAYNKPELLERRKGTKAEATVAPKK